MWATNTYIIGQCIIAISTVWNPTVPIPLCLPSFTQHDAWDLPMLCVSVVCTLCWIISQYITIDSGLLQNKILWTCLFVCGDRFHFSCRFTNNKCLTFKEITEFYPSCLPLSIFLTSVVLCLSKNILLEFNVHFSNDNELLLCSFVCV